MACGERETAADSRTLCLGAVVDLGFCLDLFSSSGTEAVARAYGDFVAYCEEAGIPIPENSGGTDLPYRNLDCAVINHLHNIRKQAGLPAFDSVSGPFIEGGTIYPGSGFRRKSHIQICLRNLAGIKGAFRVPDDQLEP